MPEDASHRRKRIAEFARMRIGGMAALLLLLAGVIFVVPTLVPEGETWELFVDALLLLILASGIAAVADHRRLAIALGLLSLVAIAVRWTEWVAPAARLPALREVSTLVALLVLASAVAINVFASGHRIGERIFGAIVLYLLVGLMFAVSYGFVERAAPASFKAQTRLSSAFADWVYFSFVTLTTVGFGDITPVTRAARALTILEALIGQLYPAVIIARLVSLSAEER